VVFVTGEAGLGKTTLVEAFAVPQALSGQVVLLPGVRYSAYRLAVVGVGLSLAVGLYVLIQHIHHDHAGLCPDALLGFPEESAQKSTRSCLLDR
jgi:hypothetical protein